MTTSMADPENAVRYLRYFGYETFRLISEHDSYCINGEESSLNDRFGSSFHSNDNLRGDMHQVMNKAILYRSSCARDHKWMHVLDAVRRKECDCNLQLLQIIAIDRLRKVSLNVKPTFLIISCSQQIYFFVIVVLYRISSAWWHMHFSRVTNSKQ
jgi:hypothetical protein